jgi:hypothetical protein
MFNIFKKKSELEVLEAKHKKCLDEWHKLSTINRSASDLKYAEAEEIAKKIEELRNNSK